MILSSCRAWRSGTSRLRGVVGCSELSKSRQRSLLRHASTYTVQDDAPLHIVKSPFPPVSDGPFPPFYEFLTKNWEPNGGYIPQDKVAIVDGTTGLQRTFGDYHRTAGFVAAALRNEMNLTPGDGSGSNNNTVAMYCPNHVDYLPVILGASLCGAKITPINPLYTTHELEIVLQRSRSSVLVTHASKLDTALQAAKQSSYVKHVIVVTDENGEAIPAGTVDLQSLREYQESAFYETQFPSNNHLDEVSKSNQTLLLPYSSGTTGLPKGVCLSHNNIIVNLLQLDKIEEATFLPHHKLISPLPFFHIYGFTVSLLYCAWKGQTIITNSGRFDLEHHCQMVQAHQPERSHLVPPIILNLAKHPVIDQYDMSSLQVIVSAAAPLDQELETQVKERLGGVMCKQAWGMSELSPIGTYNPDHSARSGSVGPPVSSTEAMVVNEHGQSLGPREPGELLIRGPQVMAGYMDEPERTAECLDVSSGWLRTGDVAWYDEDAFFYITDRVKELIKVRGFPVAPAELEALLLRHEAVNDAAVIPFEDESSGELPRAYVVLKDTASDVTERDIYDWVKERVANYKRLDGGIVFAEMIPKSASGKILRRILRDQLKDELENK